MSEEPGRAAIDRALDAIYPTEQDFRFGMRAMPDEEEPPITEIVAYRAARPAPHWHYVTYGLTELGEKQSGDAELSGYGVEYTLRLVDPGDAPPTWPIDLLRWIARHVVDTSLPFDPRHSMDLPPNVLEEVSPGVEGLGFTTDPELGSFDTPNGRVTFVEVVPLMRGEYELVGRWDIDAVFDEVRADAGDLLWRIGRKSVLDGPRGADVLAAAKRDGSSQSMQVTELEWTDGEVVLDSVSRKVMAQLLRYRIAYGRDAEIYTDHGSAMLTDGAWSMSCGDDCALAIPRDEAEQLAAAIEGALDGDVIERAGGVRLRVVLDA